MQKKFLINTTSWLLLVSFAGFNTPSGLYADSTGITTESDTQMEVRAEEPVPQVTYTGDTLSEDEDDAEPQGTQVAPTNNSAENAKKREFIKNIILAGVALVVAVVSIIYVSNNNGK